MLGAPEDHAMTDDMVYAISLLTSGLGCWAVGMWNFLKIAKQANLPYTGPTAALRIYRYAFREMRGSRQTKLMVCGFAGMFVLPAGLTLLLGYLLPLTR
jgi:hypothetical protein